MRLLRVTLEFKGAIHQGTASHAKTSGALVHSDTLYSALLHTAATLHRTAFLEAYDKIWVSSVFPVWENIHFYPKPHLSPPRQDGENTDRKRWKSIKLVSENLFSAWLAGNEDQVREAQDLGSGLAVTKAEYHSLQQRLPRRGFIHKDVLTSAVIDRITNGATPFDRPVLRVNASEKVHAYFLAQVPEDLEPAFRETMEALSMAGLGGRLAVGCGAFVVRAIEPFSFSTPYISEPIAFVTVSLYLPTREEVAAGVLDGPASYECTVRGGWLYGADTHAIRAVRMCLEGCIFKHIGKGYYGEVRDVSAGALPHRLWRSGLTLPIPVTCTRT